MITRRAMLLVVIAMRLIVPAVATATVTSPLAQVSTPATTTGVPQEHTGPGLKQKPGTDAVSWRAVRGVILIVIAVGVVVWLFRFRVRDWMIGRGRRRPPGPLE